MKNTKTIILAVISIIVVALITVLVIRNINGRNGQSIIPEEETAEEEMFENDSSIEEGELGDYGKLINELELEKLDTEFGELDEIVNEF
jgi:hypothetical protein